MSVKKWHQLAEEKSAVDQQEQEIHQKFRMDKINKEFGQLSGEELFKPITIRLDKKSSDNVEEEEEEEEEQEAPDYTMDEFDKTNPFGDEFRPDAPTPATSPSPSPEPSSLSPLPPPPSYQEVVDDDDFPSPPQSLMEETSTRKEWGVPEPVKTEYSHESTLLQTVNQLITKFGNDPNYKVKSKKISIIWLFNGGTQKSKRWNLCEKRGNKNIS